MAALTMAQALGLVHATQPSFMILEGSCVINLAHLSACIGRRPLAYRIQ